MPLTTLSGTANLQTNDNLLESYCAWLQWKNHAHYSQRIGRINFHAHLTLKTRSSSLGSIAICMNFIQCTESWYHWSQYGDSQTDSKSVVITISCSTKCEPHMMHQLKVGTTGTGQGWMLGFDTSDAHCTTQNTLWESLDDGETLTIWQTVVVAKIMHSIPYLKL